MLTAASTGEPAAPPRARGGASVRRQSLRAEGRARRGDRLRRWRFGGLERIADAERFPFEAPHLVKRQHLDTLDVTELRGERGDLRDVGGVIGQAGDQHEPHPYRQPAIGEAARELERRLVVTTGERPVALAVPGLYAEQHQIDVIQVAVGELLAQKPVGLDGSVYAHRLGARQHLHDEAALHQWLAAADRYTAPHHL